MSAAWSRAARRAIWRSWARVAAVVDWVEGELVARRTLPGAGGEEVMVGLCVEVRMGNRGGGGLWWDGELGYLVAGWMGMLEAALSVMRI